MARQRIMPQYGVKMFESYTDFSGGLNTSASNEQLRDSEYTIMENVDLLGRGGVKKRTGKTLYNLLPTGSVPQGMSYFYRKNQTTPDIIVAASGTMYVILNNGTRFEAPLSGVSFSTVPQIEMAQYNETMYIATGVKLCEIGYVSRTWNTGSAEAYLIGDKVLTSAGRIYECTESGAATTTAPSHTSGEVANGSAKFTFVANGISGFTNWYSKQVTAYKPNLDEFLYVGTNALATNPETWIDAADEDGAIVLGVKGVIPNTSQVIVNKSVSFTAYVFYNATSFPLSSLQYKWEYKKSSATAWTLYKDFAANTVNKSVSFTFNTAVKHDIRVTVRKVNYNATTWVKGSVYYAGVSYVVYNNNVYKCITAIGGPSPSDSGYSSVPPTHSSGTVDYGDISWQFIEIVGEAVYTATNYNVLATPVITKPSASIHSCTKIMLHWDRLLLYGDNVNPYQIYVSDLNNPAYFPTTNTVTFDTGKHEPVNAVVKYRDYLVVFTKTTIHTMVGKSPDEYSRALIHDGIGCIAGRTAQLTGNEIMFLSTEGVFRLRPNQFVEEKLNVFRGDDVIRYDIPKDADACAFVYNSQYWISFPTSKVMYRYYYEQNIWSKDVSEYTDAVEIMQYSGEVMELSKSGAVLKHNTAVYTDNGVSYDMTVRTKYHDLSMSFNYKKLKKFYLIARYFDATSTNLYVTIESDSVIAITPETENIEIVNDNIVWVRTVEPNMNIYAGTQLGSWVLGQGTLGGNDTQMSVQKLNVAGKCKRVRVTFKHSDDTPCEIYGIGLEFREKKV